MLYVGNQPGPIPQQHFAEEKFSCLVGAGWAELFVLLVISFHLLSSKSVKFRPRNLENRVSSFTLLYPIVDKWVWFIECCSLILSFRWIVFELWFFLLGCKIEALQHKSTGRDNIDRDRKNYLQSWRLIPSVSMACSAFNVIAHPSKFGKPSVPWLWGNV